MDEPRTWKEVLNENAKQYPNKTAFIFDGGCSTFLQVNERINRVINGLHDLGIGKGDRVGILAYNCPQYFEVMGVAKAGMACVPLNYRSTGRELVYLINHSKISSLFIGQEFVAAVNSIRSDLTGVRFFICLDASIEGMVNYEELISGHSPNEPSVDVRPGDPWIMFYTSGTTGRPKGAIHTHKSLIAETQVPNRDLSSGDIALCVMPFFHVGGSAAHLLPAFARGATILIQRKFEEEQVLRAIAEQNVTYMYLVPAMVIRILEHPNFQRYDLSSLRTLAYTGAPMPIEALKRGISSLGQVFLQFLGQTETLDMTVLKKEEHRLQGSPRERRRLESAGKPPYDGELKIVDEQGCDVAVGQVGEIVSRSDRMMTEYWRMPEETREAIKEGWLHTGDLARRDEDGYIYVVDRKKDMIISGAENIYSREIEEVLYTHPSVLEAAVVAVPDDRWGEAVKAIIVLKPSAAVTEMEMIDFCKERLASYKKPKSVEVWDSLPKTGSGKVMKNEIREKYWQGYSRRVN